MTCRHDGRILRRDWLDNKISCSSHMTLHESNTSLNQGDDKETEFRGDNGISNRNQRRKRSGRTQNKVEPVSQGGTGNRTRPVGGWAAGGLELLFFGGQILKFCVYVLGCGVPHSNTAPGLFYDEKSVLQFNFEDLCIG